MLVGTSAAAAEDLAWRSASASVLARWPVLNDPWHPAFEATLDRDLEAVRAHLSSHAAMRDWRASREVLERHDAAIWELRVEATPLERLVRSLDNLALAGRLRAKGGEDWAHFLRLRACEGSRP